MLGPNRLIIARGVIGATLPKKLLSRTYARSTACNECTLCYLSSEPLTRAFTGSTAAGRRIASIWSAHRAAMT